MNKPGRELHELARRVISSHAPSGADTASAPEAMERACGALYRVLETAMGPAGLEALVGRAIQLAAREYPWVSTVKAGTDSDCPLSGLAEAAGTVDAKAAVEGCAALLAQMMWLLATFIGEDLTTRFVRHAWPNVTFGRLEVQTQ